jgi:hypothetical protein
VIGVAAAVVPHNCANVFRHGVEVTDQVFYSFLLEIGALDGLVQVIDVSLVMFGVMNFHCARIDVRLQRIIRIG